MSIRQRLVIIGIAGILGSSALAQSPLSAIDWLSDSVQKPLVIAPTGDNDVADSAAVDEIIVTPLDKPTLDSVGLLPVSVTGFPRDLWAGSDTDTLIRLIGKIDARNAPAIQDLLYTILLAELNPPLTATPGNALFLARVDELLDMGALDQAKALLERAGPETSALFRRWFDVSLLTGTENKACAALKEKADIAPTFQTRIFCLARNGDWNAAALTLETAKALGYLSDEEDALMARFLDPLLFEGLPALPLPEQPTPLIYQMHEAIGEPIASASLPMAFAHADLRPVSGWKAQIEAAERLARSGAIDENLLLGIYTERLPAASGGLWDRVESLQKFDIALRARNPNALAKTLPIAWEQMQQIGLQTSFARMVDDKLAGLPLDDEIAALVYRIGLLSPHYEEIAQGYTPLTEEDAFVQSVAIGEPVDPPAGDVKAQAIADGFGQLDLPSEYAVLIRENRIGEAILRAADQYTNGKTGDPDDVSQAVALFRLVGLEDTARRAALEYLLLKEGT